MSETLVRAAAALIDAASAGVVAFFAIRALLATVRRDADRARLLMADGVITALGFSVAAALLKTIGLGTVASDRNVGVRPWVSGCHEMGVRGGAPDAGALSGSNSRPYSENLPDCFT